jgi:isoquinoline 1-oxidoreductase beta subunit
MKEMKKTLDRRSFLKVSTLAGGGVMLAFSTGELLAQRGGRGGRGGPPAPPPTPDTYITINPDNTFTLIAKNPETGQGIRAALPMIIAEELDVEWSQVRIQQADLHPRYGQQIEGGSTAIPSNYNTMRQVGAAARMMLQDAAAANWNVPASEVSTNGAGVVTHAASGRTATYASLAGTLTSVESPAPDDIVMKNPADFKILGTDVPGVDNLAILTGQPSFSIDVEPGEGMLYAAFEKCPVFGGVAVSANLDEIRAIPRVQHAFIVPAPEQNGDPSSGVAIVSDSWWVANNARRQLNVEWDEGPTAIESSTRYAEQATEIASASADAAPGGGGRGNAVVGDVDSAFSSAAQVVEAEYYFPMISHAPLETQNSTAHYKEDGTLEIWSPAQIPSLNDPAGGARIETNQVTFHMVRAGGGFGRRLYKEYDQEAGKISRVVSEERMAAGLPTVPVKVLWSREDDIMHDDYRPAGFHYFKAGLDANGRITSFRDFVSSIASVTPGGEFPRGFVDNFQVSAGNITPFSIPTGALRAPSTNGISFVMQSFIDELAIAADADPIQYRLDLLANPVGEGPTGGFNPERAAGVLRAVRDMSNWNTVKPTLPARRGMGAAFQFAHAGYVAYVVDASVDDNQRLTINNVWAAIDIGRQIVNTSRARNLVEGGMVEALSHMMNWEITIENGSVVQRNFPEYNPTRMSQAPRNTEVQFILSDNNPTGLGEPSLPPAIPAVTNAIFDATGVRIRRLPIANQGYRWS